MLTDLLCVNEFQITRPIINELRLALKKQEGRSYKILAC